MTDELPPNGHIKLARKAFDASHGDDLWLEPRTFSRWEAWVDVIQLAAYRPRTYHTAQGPIALLRGEFVASLRWLAARWTWTVKRVRTWIGDMEKRARLRAQRETLSGTVYMIVNYETYQTTGHSKGTAEGTPEGTDGAQQGHKKEAVKAVKAVKLPSAHAEWAARIAGYWASNVGRVTPGRVGADCKASIAAHGELAVMAGVRRYVETKKAQGKQLAWKWFADEQIAWIEKAAKPLYSSPPVDEFGVMSDEFERATRP